MRTGLPFAWCVFTTVSFSPATDRSDRAPLGAFFSTSSLQAVALLFFVVSVSVHCLRFRLSISTFMYQIVFHGFLRSRLFVYICNKFRRNITFGGGGFHLRILYFICDYVTGCFPSTFTLHVEIGNGFHRFVVVCQIVRFTRNAGSSKLSPMGNCGSGTSFISGVFLQVVGVIRVIQFCLPVLHGPLCIG